MDDCNNPGIFENPADRFGGGPSDRASILALCTEPGIPGGVFRGELHLAGKALGIMK